MPSVGIGFFSPNRKLDPTEQDRRAFDLKMEQSREDFHQKMARLDEMRQGSERRRDRLLALLALLVAIGAIAAALVTAGPGSLGFDLLDYLFHISKAMPLPPDLDGNL